MSESDVQVVATALKGSLDRDAGVREASSAQLIKVCRDDDDIL